MPIVQDGLIVAQEFDAEFGVVALCIFEIGCFAVVVGVGSFHVAYLLRHLTQPSFHLD